MTEKIDTSAEAVAAMLEGLTPGPWSTDTITGSDPNGDEWETDIEVYSASGKFIHGHDIGYSDETDAEIKYNASFIAAARELVPVIAAERDALRAENERLTEKLAKAEASALEQVAGAYLAAEQMVSGRANQYDREHGIYDHTTGVTEYPGNGCEWMEEWLDIAECVHTLTPADAIAALEARDARVRAEIASLIDAEIETSQSIMPIGAATFLALNEIKRKIDTLHTDESRKAGGDA